MHSLRKGRKVVRRCVLRLRRHVLAHAVQRANMLPDFDMKKARYSCSAVVLACDASCLPATAQSLRVATLHRVSERTAYYCNRQIGVRAFTLMRERAVRALRSSRAMLTRP